MTALIKRDLLILFRNPRGWLMSQVFFLLFLSLMAIALDAQPEQLRKMAAPVIWMSAVFSLLLTFENLFQADMRNGLFEQYYLSGLSMLSLAASKFVTVFIVCLLPLIMVVPIIGILYQLNFEVIGSIMLSLLLGAPGLIALGLVSAALLSGQRSAGFLILLLTLPFLVPVVIFALSGIESYAKLGLWNAGFQALAGLSLLSIGIGLPATAAALNANME